MVVGELGGARMMNLETARVEVREVRWGRRK
jgi:hypothetical protein